MVTNDYSSRLSLIFSASESHNSINCFYPLVNPLFSTEVDYKDWFFFSSFVLMWWFNMLNHHHFIFIVFSSTRETAKTLLGCSFMMNLLCTVASYITVIDVDIQIQTFFPIWEIRYSQHMVILYKRRDLHCLKQKSYLTLLLQLQCTYSIYMHIYGTGKYLTWLKGRRIILI